MSDNIVRINILTIILALQLAFIGVFFLDKIGIEIPILRQLVAFLYLIFVPGMLLILILRIYKMEVTDIFLYSIGLSLSSLMILGVLLNSVAPLVGVSRPITELPLFVTITAFSAILFAFCAFRRREEYVITFEMDKYSNALLAILFLLPLFLAVIGDYFVYYKNNNIVLLIFLVIVSLVAFSSVFKNLQLLYPFIIFTTALSLIYHIVLSSPYSLGGDVCIEYGFSNLVVLNGIWNPFAIYSNNNAVASTNILIPTFCVLCEMTATQVFKVIFPVVLSSVPLALYSILKKQIKPELAFLSSYFYISVRPFYGWISEFVKQGFAMFFITLIILTLLTRKEKKIEKEIILILFSFSLIVSHYGTSYIFMISLIVVCILLWTRMSEVIPANYILLYVASVIIWYMYISSGSAIDTIATIGSHIISNLQELFNPKASEGLKILSYTHPALSYRILKILYLITNFFIVFGFLSVVYYRLRGKENSKYRFEDVYFYFSIPSIIFLLASVALPYFTGLGSMGLRRLYIIVLIFLAPFCIIGVIELIVCVQRLLGMYYNSSLIITILAAFFAIFLLFNSGWVTEVSKEHIGSVAISQPRIKCCGTIKEKASFYCNYFAEEDVFSAIWLSKYRINSKICFDFYSMRVLCSYGMLVGRSWPRGKDLLTKDSINELDKNTYIYLRKINWRDGIMTKVGGIGKNWIWNTSDILVDLNKMSKIYSNYGSVILLY